MSATWALTRRELVRFFRQPSRIVGAMAPPILAWLMMGFGFGSSFRAPGGGTLSYFFPGTIVLVVLFASIFSTISVIEDRREGFLQSVLVSPAHPFEIALGKVLGGTLLGLMQGGSLLLLMPFLKLPWKTLNFAAGFGILCLLAFALTGLGFAIAWSLESTQGFHAVMNLFLLPMWLLSGAFFPVAGAAPWMRVVMSLNPLTYGLAALRRGLDPAHSQHLPSFALSALVTVAFGVLTMLVSVIVVSRKPASR